MADGTWGAPVAGPGQRCELCALKNGVGVVGAAHPVGRNPNLPEAAGSGHEMGQRQCLPGGWALRGTTGPSQPRLEANAPQGASRHQLRVQRDKALGCRLSLAEGICLFATTCSSSPAKETTRQCVEDHDSGQKH